MMVQMTAHAREGDRRGAVSLWHSTISRLAIVMFPLAAFLLVAARPVIVALFTTKYLASVPIFMVWTLTIVPSAFAVDGVLRVYAQTRFLLVMNVLRFALVVVLIWPFLSIFGMSGAVLVTLLATSVAKGVGAVRIARLLGAGLRDALPWARLTGIASSAGVAAVPALWIVHTVTLPPLAVLACAGVVYGGAYAALLFGSTNAARQIVPSSFAMRRRLAAWMTPQG
jgi:O-antigen/teichoic acid export membrane protein